MHPSKFFENIKFIDKDIRIVAAEVVDEDLMTNNCDYKSLQKLLDDWYKEQTGTTIYYPCYKEYVKIDWSRYNEQ